jgi:hypothetical protein
MIQLNICSQGKKIKISLLIPWQNKKLEEK